MTQERPQGENDWIKERIGENHFIDVSPLDPEIVKQMPSSSKNFLQVSPIEILLNDIREFFNLR